MLGLKLTVIIGFIKKHSINFFADARFLPFRDKCFEELRIYHVLEHIQDWKQALSECCRVSRMLSIEVPKEPIILNVWMLGISIRFRKFSNWILKRKEKECSYRRHLWKFNPQIVVTFLRNHGFHDIKVETIYTVIPIIRFLAHGLAYKRKSNSHFIDRRKSNFSHFAGKCLRGEFSWRIEAKSYEALSS